MIEDDPFPDFPDMPKGMDLHERRRWVNSHAIHINRWRVRRSKAVGTQWMKWTSVDEPETCDSCRQDHRKIYFIEEMDVDSHLARCSCDDGCGCICLAVMGPELTISPDEFDHAQVVAAYLRVIQASHDRYALDDDLEEHRKLWRLTLEDVLRMDEIQRDLKAR